MTVYETWKNLGKFLNSFMKEFKSFSVESLLAGNAGLKKVLKRNNFGNSLNDFMKDFKSFSVESLLGGNAGLRKSSEKE